MRGQGGVRPGVEGNFVDLRRLVRGRPASGDSPRRPYSRRRVPSGARGTVRRARFCLRVTAGVRRAAVQRRHRRLGWRFEGWAPPMTVGEGRSSVAHLRGRVPAAAAMCSSVRPSSSFLLSLASSSSEENSEKYVVLPSCAFSSAILFPRSPNAVPRGVDPSTGGSQRFSVRAHRFDRAAPRPSPAQRFQSHRPLKNSHKAHSTMKRSVPSPPRPHKARFRIG